jgi:hypothetical protein
MRVWGRFRHFFAEVADNPWLRHHGEEGGGGAAAQPGTPVVISSPVYLALDQSTTNIGWARASPGWERPECNTYRPPPAQAPDGRLLRFVPLLLGIEPFLEAQIERHGVSHVFIESVYFDDSDMGNVRVFDQLSTVRDFVHYVCGKWGIPCEEVEPKTWRKHFLGYWRKQDLSDDVSLKDAAMTMCRHVGWSVVDEHQAEAIGILTYALCRDYPRFAPHWDTRLLGATP